ncbi:MAG: type II secretion system protein [Acidobacteria bacterium]|nr:type II secretion system protein [Acidobacteriota bacterium]
MFAKPPNPRRATPGAPSTPPARSAGLTLVETLVTFVIFGFLTTLILQAVGFFAARYEGVQRVHRASALETLQQNYFATTVRGLVPYGVDSRRFQGDATFFEGTTLEPLNAEPGVPVIARWSIADDTVGYAESAAPGEDGIAWTVRTSADSHAFEYADSLGNWYDHWPPSVDRLPRPGEAPLQVIDDPAYDWTPTLIRLVSPDAATVWLARVEPSRRPVLTEALYR